MSGGPVKVLAIRHLYERPLSATVKSTESQFLQTISVTFKGFRGLCFNVSEVDSISVFSKKTQLIRR